MFLVLFFISLPFFLFRNEAKKAHGCNYEARPSITSRKYESERIIAYGYEPLDINIYLRIDLVLFLSFFVSRINPMASIIYLA